MTFKKKVFTLLFIFTLPGCTAIQRMVGMRVDLEGKPVKNIRGELAGGPALCPGMSAPLIVTAILEDGTFLTTMGAGGGKVPWDNFRFETDGAVVSTDGLLTLSADPRVNYGKDAAYKVIPIHHPAKVFSGAVKARYDCGYVADFSGEPGRNGANGGAGHDGRDGKDEQSSPSYAKPGGHGEDGGSGGNGDNGESGRSGDQVEVRVAAVKDAASGKTLLQVLVRSLARDKTVLYLVDAAAGSLTVNAGGGSGGSGGMGGMGGRGGHGGTGAPAGNGGNGGDGGNGGNGGDGGDGGRITVLVDPAANVHIGVIKLENAGGSSGSPGPGGAGGSGGYVYSGGTQGNSGRSGQSGNREGRAGRDGPKPEIQVTNVGKLW